MTHLQDHHRHLCPYLKLSLCPTPYLLFDVMCRTIMDTCAYDAQVRQFLDPSTVVLVGHR